MANREQRGNKEKKKPKADKNKKDKHQPFGGHTAPGQSQDHPGFNVLAKKTTPNHRRRCGEATRPRRGGRAAARLDVTRDPE